MEWAERLHGDGCGLPAPTWTCLSPSLHPGDSDILAVCIAWGHLRCSLGCGGWEEIWEALRMARTQPHTDNLCPEQVSPSRDLVAHSSPWPFSLDCPLLPRDIHS